MSDTGDLITQAELARPYRQQVEAMAGYGIPDTDKLHFAGRLAPVSRNAEGLEAMIGEYFQVPVRVEPFVGLWVPLPPEARWRPALSPPFSRLITVIAAR